MKRVVTVSGSLASADYPRPYQEALRAVGIELAPVTAAPMPAIAAGLLLMGGSDVNPARYGEARDAQAEEADNVRDELECALIEEALARDLPLLAICRGLQILNVQHGGTLIQHLPSSARHRQRTENRGMPVHQIEIVPGTVLAAITGGSLRLGVNSRHHQAIHRLGEGLLISARDSEDGTIEAVERPDKPFVVGVQWHPENMSATDPSQAHLFQAFAEALQTQEKSRSPKRPVSVGDARP
jgi:gamma-glutamyl-gamma-aminobutyrate hydrolase PuuD